MAEETCHAQSSTDVRMGHLEKISKGGEIMKSLITTIAILALLLASPVLAVDIDFGLGAEIVDQGNSSKELQDVPNTYGVRAGLSQPISVVVPYVYGQFNFGDHQWDVVSKEYAVGVKSTYEGFTFDGMYNVEKFPTGGHLNTFQLWVNRSF